MQVSRPVHPAMVSNNEDEEMSTGNKRFQYFDKTLTGNKKFCAMFSDSEDDEMSTGNKRFQRFDKTSTGNKKFEQSSQVSFCKHCQ